MDRNLSLPSPPRPGKPFNGVFRAWTKVSQDSQAQLIIWGHCLVHLSHPEFSGNILHTSGILAISEFATFNIAETCNNFYALLGPELIMPVECPLDPEAYVMQHRDSLAAFDNRISAAMTARPHCKKCHGSGVYRYSCRRLAVCDECCKHNQGWWQLEGAYGLDNGRWACKAGCGMIVDVPPLELEFLPRAGK